MERWRVSGGVSSRGSRRSRRFSRRARCFSRRVSRFIRDGRPARGRSGGTLDVGALGGGLVPFEGELARHQLAVGLLEQHLHLVFRLFELLLALLGELDAFFEELEGVVEGQVAGFELLDDLLQAVQGILKAGHVRASSRGSDSDSNPTNAMRQTAKASGIGKVHRYPLAGLKCVSEK